MPVLCQFRSQNSSGTSSRPVRKQCLSPYTIKTKCLVDNGLKNARACSQSRRSSQAELHPGNSSAAAERLLSDVISEKTYHVHHKNYSTRSESVLLYNLAPAGGLDAGKSIVGATRCGRRRSIALATERCPGQALYACPYRGFITIIATSLRLSISQAGLTVISQRRGFLSLLLHWATVPAITGVPRNPGLFWA